MSIHLVGGIMTTVATISRIQMYVAMTDSHMNVFVNDMLTLYCNTGLLLQMHDRRSF